MAVSRAWVLNLDAEEELARPAGYSPSRAVLARCLALSESLRPLLGPGDLVIAQNAPPSLQGGNYVGRAWCPTPRALQTLSRAGVRPPPAPGVEVLRKVNHRAFCAALGQGLPGARYVYTLGALREA